MLWAAIAVFSCLTAANGNEPESDAEFPPPLVEPEPLPLSEVVVGFSCDDVGCSLLVVGCVWVDVGVSSWVLLGVLSVVVCVVRDVVRVGFS